MKTSTTGPHNQRLRHAQESLAQQDKTKSLVENFHVGFCFHFALQFEPTVGAFSPGSCFLRKHINGWSDGCPVPVYLQTYMLCDTHANSIQLA